MSKKVDCRPRSRTQASHIPVFAIFHALVNWLLTCLHCPVMTAPHFYKFPGWYLRGKLEGPHQLRALRSFCSGALIKRCWPEFPTGAIQLHAGLLIREQGRPKWLSPLLSTVWDSTRVQYAVKSGVTWCEQFSSMTSSTITFSFFVPLLPSLSKEISVQCSSRVGQSWPPDPPMPGESPHLIGLSESLPPLFPATCHRQVAQECIQTWPSLSCHTLSPNPLFPGESIACL